MSIQITGTPEILGAIGSSNESAIKEVASKIDAEVKTVSNSAKEVHLALPYYSGINTPASVMSDSDLAAASGGAAACCVENNAACCMATEMCCIVDDAMSCVAGGGIGAGSTTASMDAVSGTGGLGGTNAVNAMSAGNAK